MECKDREPTLSRLLLEADARFRKAGRSVKDSYRTEMSNKGQSRETLVVLACLKKVRKWPEPPRWSKRDWSEEIRAELSMAAIEASRDFDESRGVPWEGFLSHRLMARALSRYRREWSHAIHLVSLEAMGEYAPPDVDGLPLRDTLLRLIHEALERLPPADASFIEGLFWGGDTESTLAHSLGISQQAINKRKRNILKTLHRLIHTIAKNYDDSWL
jgi:DNA-directed RNA polymerase specialized sigma24 family protein